MALGKIDANCPSCNAEQSSGLFKTRPVGLRHGADLNEAGLGKNFLVVRSATMATTHHSSVLLQSRPSQTLVKTRVEKASPWPPFVVASKDAVAIWVKKGCFAHATWLPLLVPGVVVRASKVH